MLQSVFLKIKENIEREKLIVLIKVQAVKIIQTLNHKTISC